MGIFKYAHKIKEVLGIKCTCPSKDAKEVDIEAFRFEFKANPKHLPRYFIKPPRIQKGRNVSCSFFGLSCYTSLEEIQNIIQIRLSENTEFFVNEEIGDSIFHGIIKNNLGRCTSPRQDGHFDFFEYIDCNTIEEFKYLKDIVNA